MLCLQKDDESATLKMFMVPLSIDRTMRVAFQGVHGAFSEVAARAVFGNSCTPMPCATFGDVFASVEQRRADRGIIPIENSLAGSIHQNYDLLLAHALHIVGEIHLRIEHALICHPAASMRTLRRVRSHPMALDQCSAFLSRFPSLQPEAYFDTAGAAASVAETKDVETAAVASDYAARLYGLKVLHRNIENRLHNFTRFLVLSRTAWEPKRGVRAKTSIVFIPTTNEAGALFRSLGVFAVRNIDLLKIESRPDLDAPFEYMFYLDVDGSPSSQHVADALEHLQALTKMFRLLGVYPMGKGEFYGAARWRRRR